MRALIVALLASACTPDVALLTPNHGDAFAYGDTITLLAVFGQRAGKDHNVAVVPHEVSDAQIKDTDPPEDADTDADDTDTIDPDATVYGVWARLDGAGIALTVGTPDSVTAALDVSEDVGWHHVSLTWHRDDGAWGTLGADFEVLADATPAADDEAEDPAATNEPDEPDEPDTDPAGADDTDT